MPAALEGLIVLDLATFVAAPMCTTLLGEFGAEVIKVEQPGVGDDLRRLGRRTDGVSLWWLSEARNKKSITCNLRTAEGQALIRRLAAQSDIVAENFRPGTMERWNLGYEELAAVNRRVILVRVSAFGQTGPYRERPGFGRIAAAVGGVSYLSGYPDRPPVTPGTPTIPDYLAGVMAALGALIALQHRARTGEGQVVDVALYEPILRMLDELVPVYGATGHIRERVGSGTEYVVPHNHYRTRDGRWLAIACTNDRMFQRLLRALGQEGPIERYGTMEDRVRLREELDGLIQEWLLRYDAEDALNRLDQAEVPASLVYSVRDLFQDPHVKARENILAMANPLGGLLHLVGVVPRLSRTPGSVRTTGPLRIGEHNDEIYRGRLGLSASDIEALQRAGVI